MKKLFSASRRLTALALAVLMLGCAFFAGGASVQAGSKLTDATVQNYEDQIAKIQEQQTAIRAKLNKLAKEKASLSEYKAELDNYLATTMRKIEAARTLLGELEVKIAETEANLAQNSADYEAMRQKFLDMMVLSHEEGEASYIGLILGADSLGDFLSRMERVSSMLEYNKSIMETLDGVGRALEEDRAELEEALAVQVATMKELEADEADYQKECDEVIRQIQDLSKNQSAAQKELATQQKLEAELDKQLEEYLAELQRKNQAKMEAGEWLWPIRLNVDQYCSAVFGWRILYGVWDYHRGWDIACWLGNDILASKSCTVVISTYHKSYGNYVVIDHGDGVSTVYAHCSKLLVSVGDKVKQGDVIGKVGTTGNSTGYHLHFEFRLNGKYTDPFNYIKEPPISVGASRYQKW